jgi:hypothetical protein
MPRDAGVKKGISPGMRIYLLSVAAVALLSVLALLLFYSPEKPKAEQTLRIEADGSVYSRLILPQEKRGLIASDHLPLRPKRQKWTREQVERYWIPPRSIVLELLRYENEAVLEEIFESVP